MYFGVLQLKITRFESHGKPTRIDFIATSQLLVQLKLNYFISLDVLFNTVLKTYFKKSKPNINMYSEF